MVALSGQALHALRRGLLQDLPELNSSHTSVGDIVINVATLQKELFNGFKDTPCACASFPRIVSDLLQVLGL